MPTPKVNSWLGWRKFIINTVLISIVWMPSVRMSNNVVYLIWVLVVLLTLGPIRDFFMPTYERLDQCLANAEWCRVFPTTTVFHLPMMYSDHAPILLLPSSQRQRPKNPFDLKTSGSWRKTSTTLRNSAGNNLLNVLSLIKLIFWLQI
jgi:hypothetical protein